MVEYGTASYWDKRYEKDFGKTFDWLGPYKTVRLLLNKHVILPMYQKEETTIGDDESICETAEFEQFVKSVAGKLRVLDLGCGNSTLAEEMYDVDGYR